MKNMIKLPAVVLGLMLLLTGTTQRVMAQNEDVSLQSFYDELSPYGQWIQDPQYGYVWRPDVDQDEFRPYYTNGRWAMTEYGNTWVSNYDWGWAPFHYGRWVYNRYNNWVWIPDTVWGPAWVSWRSGGGYYGWAPLGPSISIGINIGRGGYRIPDMCWNFIPYNNIYYNSYPRYYGGRNRVYIQNTVIINNTYVRNNRTYYTGPRVDEVRRATNQQVTVYNVNRSNRPGASRVENNSVNIYSPRPSREGNNNAAPRNAVQGNINRGPVQMANRPGRGNDAGNTFGTDRGGRDNNVIGNRPERGNVGGNDRNGSMDNRNGNMATRPARGGNEVNPVQGRDNNNGVGNRPERGNFDGNDRNSNLDNRNGNMATRPARGGNEVNPVQGRDNNNGMGNRPNGFDNNRERPNSQPQRIERNNEMPQVQPQRVERSREMPQQPRVERQQPVQQAPQRMESRPEPQQRTERQQQAPQRVERSQPQPQRVERTQSAPERSRGGEARGNAGGGGGRPGRG